jgi:hypothetical protein
MTQFGIKLHLIKVAERKKDVEFQKALWRTYHCQDELITSVGRAYSETCKNRFCLICQGNRKADIINRYFPVLRKWKAPYFATLTANSIRAKNSEKW